MSDKSVYNFIKNNLQAIVISGFFCGVFYTTTELRNSYQDEKIANLKLENESQQNVISLIKEREDKSSWSIEQINLSISALQNDNKITQNTISDIKAKIDVLSTKMDNQEKKIDQLIDLTKKNNHN